MNGNRLQSLLLLSLSIVYYGGPSVDGRREYILGQDRDGAEDIAWGRVVAATTHKPTSIICSSDLGEA